MERRLSDFFTPEIFEKAGLISSQTEYDPVITGLEYDSRQVKPGDLFFALPGLHTNGRLYIDDAIKKGAAAVVYEGTDIGSLDNIAGIKVKSSRFAMSPIAASFYDNPSRRMFVTGVTGTEGKSTTVYFIWQLLNLIGKKAGFFSTVQQCLGKDLLWNSEHQTTPEAPIVQRYLWEMAKNGCEYAVVESSSHGLSEKTNRLGDVNFCCAVLTNIHHEHLEFHGTWEKYRDDKANLFRALNRYVPCEKNTIFEPFGVISGDDANCGYFVEKAKCKSLLYSVAGAKEADIVITQSENGSQGSSYRVFIPQLNEHIEIKDNLPGSFNMGNVLAALLVVSGLTKIPVREIAKFVDQLKPVRGRMTTINKGQPFEVLVDYAHTPSSFLAIYPPLKKRLKKTGGSIISVFGSAGERDTAKRAQQGKIASEYSDVIILTDEDPRGEPPMDILEEIAGGVCNVFKRGENLFLIPDRPSAIRKAVSLAKKGDLVLLLGKGHENSIIYADHVMPYDEITEAEKALFH